MRIKSLVLPLVLVLAAAGAWFFLQTSDQGTSGGVPGAAPATAGKAAASPQPSAELVSAEAGPTASAPSAERSLAQPAGALDPAVTFAAEPKSSPGRVIRGRVVDESSRPIAGARIFKSEDRNRFFLGEPGKVLEQPKSETKTAADGRFELAWPEEFEIPAEALALVQPRIEVRAEEYAPLKHTLRLPPEGDLDVGDLLLGPGLVINGRVLDHAGNPVLGALVFADAEDAAIFAFLRDAGRTPDAVTDGTGAFQLRSLAFAAWNLRVEHPEQPIKRFTGQPPEQGRILNGLVLELDRPGSIAGLVTGLPNDASQYEVRARRVADGAGFIGGPPERTAKLEAGGRFSLSGLNGQSNYDLSVAVRSADGDRQGWNFESFLVSVCEPKRVSAGTQGVELKYQAPARLCLQVVDDQSGTPIERYRVQLQMGFRMTTEDGGKAQDYPDGRCCLEDLRQPDARSGFYSPDPTLKLSAEGYLDQELVVPELKSGQVTDLGVVRLQPVPRLTVTVVDDASGKPVPDVRVELRAQEAAQDGEVFGSTVTFRVSSGAASPVGSNPSQYGQTDQDGQVHFNAFAGSKAELIARHSAFATLKQSDLSLDIKAPSALELRLLRGGNLRVQVLDPAGQAVVGGLVEVVPERAPGNSPLFFGPGMEAESRSSATDSSGIALIQHLAAGNYLVRTKEPRRDDDGMVFVYMEDQGGTPKGQAVTVVEGETVDVILRDEPRGQLVGRILEAGSVLAGAMVQVSKKGEMPAGLMFGSPSGRCDGNGRFEIKDLTAGEYTVLVTAPSRATPYKTTQRILAGENRLNLDLSVSFLEGRVVDDKGQPLVGVDVSARVVESTGEVEQFIGATIMVAGTTGGGMMELSGAPPAGKGRTDADGRYQLRGVTPGVQVVVEASPGEKNPLAKSGQSEAVSVEEGRTQTVPDIKLEVAGCLELQALGADGQPLASAFLSFTPTAPDKESDGIYRMLDGEGKARLTGLSAGTWRATVQILAPETENTEHSQEFEVISGQTSSGVLRFP